MKAVVIATNTRKGQPTLTTINGNPVKIGDAVDVDEATFRNLSKKGILSAEKPAEGQPKQDTKATHSKTK